MHTDPGSIRFFLAQFTDFQTLRLYFKKQPQRIVYFSETHESAIYCVQRTYFTEQFQKIHFFLQDARFLSQNFVFNN